MKRTAIKFCGLVQAEDVRLASAMDIDYLGFVFYARSPRALDIDQATALRRLMPAHIGAVGLFVNASAQEVAHTIARVGLDIVQFHGDEPPALCAQCDRPWWRAVRLRAADDLLKSQQQFASAAAFLVDAFSDGFGGAGVAINCTLADAAMNLIRTPEDHHSVLPPLIWSGGLDATSVAAVVERYAPWAVDVSTGIQVSGEPRRKSAQKMADFVAAVRTQDKLLQMAVH